MLQAILLNKSGRNLSSGEVHWRQLFTASEDSLTSTIFGNLFHLPRNLFWAVVRNSCYHNILPEGDHKILSIEYWPHWSATDSGNSIFIEPDIFIRTDSFDLIVEAKRYDYDQQYVAQWKNEFQGYLNHYKEDKKQTFLWAVGGITNEMTENINLGEGRLIVIKSRWFRILKEVKILKAKLQNKNSVETDHIISIVNDLIIGFRIHGYAAGEWFEDPNFMDLTPIRPSSLIELSVNPFSHVFKY